MRLLERFDPELDERTITDRRRNADARTMNAPLVRCSSCSRSWHSRTMANGLRDVGSCPRCGGELVWSDDVAGEEPATAHDAAGVAPHLVLGVPRR